LAGTIRLASVLARMRIRAAGLAAGFLPKDELSLAAILEIAHLAP
jgi:hypothetical protein